LPFSGGIGYKENTIVNDYYTMPEFRENNITIDAHHHLWRYSVDEYDWIDDRMEMLRRDFSVADLVLETASAGVDHTIIVQARQSVEETRELLALADSDELIVGVVGWLPLTDPTRLAWALQTWGNHRAMIGLRHVLQSEPAGFLRRRDFNQGISSLKQYDLAYDLLILADQLPEAIEFVDTHPEQRFILDHLAKPRIAPGEMEPWRSNLRRLAERSNVWCKISGLATEADWVQWSPTILEPYLDAAVEAFGLGRLIAGTDWPVCLVACRYARWWQVLREYFAAFTPEEQAGVFGRNAIDAYQLSSLSARHP